MEKKLWQQARRKRMQVTTAKREEKDRKKRRNGRKIGKAAKLEGRKGRRKSWHSLLLVLSSQTHVFLLVLFENNV